MPRLDLDAIEERCDVNDISMLVGYARELETRLENECWSDADEEPPRDLDYGEPDSTWSVTCLVAVNDGRVLMASKCGSPGNRRWAIDAYEPEGLVVMHWRLLPKPSGKP